MSATETRQAIESILMVADNPVEPSVLAQLLEVPKADVEALCDELAAEYEAAGRGFILARVAGGYRFQSHPDLAPYVERFVLDGQTSRLSSAALETLAIVAYKQPISRMQIAAIRGVNVDGVLRTLQQRGYVDEISRDSGPGNAVLFGTTDLFLERVGLDSTADLPPLAEFVPGADVVEALEDGLRPDPVETPAPKGDESTPDASDAGGVVESGDEVTDAPSPGTVADRDAPLEANEAVEADGMAVIDTVEEADGIEVIGGAVEADGIEEVDAVEADDIEAIGAVEADGIEEVDAVDPIEAVDEAENIEAIEDVEVVEDVDWGDEIEVIEANGVVDGGSDEEAGSVEVVGIIEVVEIAGEARDPGSGVGGVEWAGEAQTAASDAAAGSAIDEVIDLVAEETPLEPEPGQDVARLTELEEELAAIDALAADMAEADSDDATTWSPAESSIVTTVRHDPPEAEPAAPFRSAPDGLGGTGTEAGPGGQDLASGQDLGPGEAPPLTGPDAGDH